jgi:hypothetical protein
MLKKELYLLDTHFSHASSSSWYNEPTYFTWVRKNDMEHIFVTDSSLHIVNQLQNLNKFGWLLESPEITKSSYEFIMENYEKFDLVFTFDENLLKLSEKFILTPLGGCWIEQKNRKIYNKTKKVSFILSHKKLTSGQIFRHEIYKTGLLSEEDVFGFNNPIKNKITALQDYRYSIVVENTNSNYYFTEKLIDCFVTGTIPIYWGCPKIDNFFDIDGIIKFENLNELKNILKNLDDDFYNKKLKHIQKNFELAQHYIVAENYIFDYINKKNLLK